MPIRLPAPRVAKSLAPSEGMLGLGWLDARRGAALASCAGALSIVFTPGVPLLARLLGAAAAVAAGLSATLPVRSPGLAPVIRFAPTLVAPAPPPKPPEPEPEPPHVLIAPPEPLAPLEEATEGTAKDMQTALGLLGAAILDQVETSVRTVLQENYEMREVAREMATGASEAEAQFKTTMSRTEAAAAGFGQLNTISGELAGSIRAIGTAVRNSIATVKDATAQAATTRQCMEAMATLSDAVSKAIEVIDHIARQTRMLAINALIETARAGEAGRGFAVVAGEVRTLANQTAAATQTIGEKIQQMNAMVTRSVDSLHALAGTIATVDSSNESIATVIVAQENLADRVAESSRSMQAAVASLAKEIREAAQLASNSGMLSEMVLETANSVDNHMGKLKTSLQEIGIGMDASAQVASPAAPDHALQMSAAPT